MNAQTGLSLKSSCFINTIFVGVTLLAPVPALCQIPLPPGPGGSPNEYQLEDLEISLQRTECFEACPVYTVSIRGEGQVTYEGDRHVRVKGRQESTIDRAAVLELLEKVYHARSLR